jgi:hypothetical protein
MDNNNKILVKELTKLLLGGNAHADLKTAIKGLPAELRCVVPD